VIASGRPRWLGALTICALASGCQADPKGGGRPPEPSGSAAGAPASTVSDAGPSGEGGAPQSVEAGSEAGDVAPGPSSAGGSSLPAGDAGAGADPGYVSSCEAQGCTSDERCLEGPAGTYCAHPCPGQPCPPGAAVPYCTRTGGVICTAE